MTTENYFAQEDFTYELGTGGDNIDDIEPGTSIATAGLGESADYVSRNHSEFVAFSQETQVVDNGRILMFNESYAGYYYESDALYIHSDRGHTVKFQNFSVNTKVSCSFNGWDFSYFKLGKHHQSNSFTYEHGVQYIGSSSYDKVVSKSKLDETYYFNQTYDVEEINLSESTAKNIVDTTGNDLNGKVIVGGSSSTTVNWDKFSGDAKFIANGRNDGINFGSTTIDDISSINFIGGNQIAFTMSNNKTLTVEGNKLENIVFGGQNIGINYTQKSFYVK